MHCFFFGGCYQTLNTKLAVTALLSAAVLPLQVEHPVTKQVFRFWFESPVVSMPTKDDAPTGADTRLYPRDCREGVSSR